MKKRPITARESKVLKDSFKMSIEQKNFELNPLGTIYKKVCQKNNASPNKYILNILRKNDLILCIDSVSKDDIKCLEESFQKF